MKDYIKEVMTVQEYKEFLHKACYEEWLSYVFDDRGDNSLHSMAEEDLETASLYFRNGVHLSFEISGDHVSVRDNFFNEIIHVSGYRV